MRLAKLVHSLLVARRWMCKNLFRIVINFCFFSNLFQKQTATQQPGMHFCKMHTQLRCVFIFFSFLFSFALYCCFSLSFALENYLTCYRNEGKHQERLYKPKHITILKIVGTKDGFQMSLCQLHVFISTFRTRTYDLLTWNRSRLSENATDSRIYCVVEVHCVVKKEKSLTKMANESLKSGNDIDCMHRG